MTPVILATSSEPTFSSNISPGGGGLLTPIDGTNIPIIVGAVVGGVILIITAVIVVVVLVKCHSRKRSKRKVKPDTGPKTTQPNGAWELNKADLEKGECFGVNKQTEVEKKKSTLDGSEETKIDPEKGNGTAVNKPNKVGNAKRNKTTQHKVASDDSEIAPEKGKLADTNTTTTITVAVAAAKPTAKPTTTTSKGGDGINNVQGKPSLQVEKPKSNNLKPAPPPPSSQRGESTCQPVAKKRPKQEDLVTSRKKTGNRSEPRKNSSSADQLTAPSEHTNVKRLPPLAKQSNATKQQEANTGVKRIR